MPLANAEQRLLSLLSTLEECQAVLSGKASPEAGRLLSLAILELRMELHKVTDAELKTLCDLVVNEVRTGTEPEAKSPQGRPLPPYLKLIK